MEARQTSREEPELHAVFLLLIGAVVCLAIASIDADACLTALRD
jgi:hypothetical protein